MVRFCSLGVLLVVAPVCFAADVLLVGCVEPRNVDVVVPIAIRDGTGTPLGRDRRAGQGIDSLSLRITASPQDVIESMTVRRSESIQKEPLFELAPAAGPIASYVVSYREGDLVAPRRGEDLVVAHLVIKLRELPASPIQLRIDREVSILANQGGTIEENQRNETLEFSDGCIAANSRESVNPGRETP